MENHKSEHTYERKIKQCYSKSSELIANEFNQFFVAVGEKTANATTPISHGEVSTTNPIPILSGDALHEMFKLSRISCTEVLCHYFHAF